MGSHDMQISSQNISFTKVFGQSNTSLGKKDQAACRLLHGLTRIGSFHIIPGGARPLKAILGC